MNRVPSKSWLKIKEYRFLIIHISAWLLMSLILFIALTITNTQDIRRFDSAIKAESADTFNSAKGNDQKYIVVFGPIESSETFNQNINDETNHIYISTRYEEDVQYTDYEVQKDAQGRTYIESEMKHEWKTTRSETLSTDYITIYDTQIAFDGISVIDSARTHSVSISSKERVYYSYIPDEGYGTVFGYWKDGEFNNVRLFMGMNIEEARNELNAGKGLIRFAGFMIIEFLLLAMFVPGLLPISLTTSPERIRKRFLIFWRIALVITAIADIVIFFIIRGGI